MADNTPATTKQPSQGALVHEWLETQIAPQVVRALPAGYSPQHFVRAAWSVCRANQRLLACTPTSLAAGILNAAQIGLEFGPLGHAYLIPFKNKGRYEATLVIGYKGYVDLARRAGQSVIGRAVYEGDDFDYSYGTGEFIRHRPEPADRGELTYAYGIARGTDGAPPAFVVLSRGEVEKRRARSRAANDGPWVTDYDPMAVKTAVRALVPWLRMTPELARAEAVDEADLADLPGDMGLYTDGGPVDVDTIDVEPVAGQGGETGAA